jgi:hypothetical protein
MAAEYEAMDSDPRFDPMDSNPSYDPMDLNPFQNQLNADSYTSLNQSIMSTGYDQMLDVFPNPNLLEPPDLNPFENMHGYTPSYSNIQTTIGHQSCPINTSGHQSGPINTPGGIESYLNPSGLESYTNTPGLVSYPTTSSEPQSYPTNTPGPKSYPTTSSEPQSYPTNTPGPKSRPINTPAIEAYLNAAGLESYTNTSGLVSYPRTHGLAPNTDHSSASFSQLPPLPPSSAPTSTPRPWGMLWVPILRDPSLTPGVKVCYTNTLLTLTNTNISIQDE